MDHIDHWISQLVDEGILSMGWDDECEDFVFWMTEEQQQGIRVRIHEGNN